jgi:hypothetical protein
MRAAGISASVIERYPNIDEATLAPIAEAIHGDRAQRWALEQRGFWVHGVSTLGEYLKATVPLPWRDGSTPSVAPPPSPPPRRPRSADRVYEALRCPKTLLRFAAAEGPATTARCATAACSTNASSTGSTTSSQPLVPSHSAAAGSYDRAGRLRGADARSHDGRAFNQAPRRGRGAASLRVRESARSKLARALPVDLAAVLACLPRAGNALGPLSTHPPPGVRLRGIVAFPRPRGPLRDPILCAALRSPRAG